jgi:hypothetical protein
MLKIIISLFMLSVTLGSSVMADPSVEKFARCWVMNPPKGFNTGYNWLFIYNQPSWLAQYNKDRQGRVPQFFMEFYTGSGYHLLTRYITGQKLANGSIRFLGTNPEESLELVITTASSGENWDRANGTFKRLAPREDRFEGQVSCKLHPSY